MITVLVCLFLIWVSFSLLGVSWQVLIETLGFFWAFDGVKVLVGILVLLMVACEIGGRFENTRR